MDGQHGDNNYGIYAYGLPGYPDNSTNAVNGSIRWTGGADTSPPVLRVILQYKRSIYQDRLGTSIAYPEGKGVFCRCHPQHEIEQRGDGRPSVQRCGNRLFRTILCLCLL